MIISFRSPLDAEAVAFLSQETGIDFGMQDMRHWFCVTARADGPGAVVGVLACEPKTWFDWHFSCAVADQRVLSRRLLRAIFRALFSRAVRITALVDPSNEVAIKGVRQMGFLYEGYGRLMVEGTRDALMFGMLAHECPWLVHSPRRARHGDVLGLRHPTDVPRIDAAELPRVASVPGNGLGKGS